jgi:organic hydroperoxide reductase OsmC/OhrA
MQDFPHHYAVSATAEADSTVNLTSEGVTAIESVAPVEFGGPGGHWSPESLLVAAVADCFVLSFKAIARASRLEWINLDCDVVGVLEKVDGVTRFTGFEVKSHLTVPTATDEAKAHRQLERAERACLITNSLIAESTLTASVTVAD